jgi:hypothetical protein
MSACPNNGAKVDIVGRFEKCHLQMSRRARPSEFDHAIGQFVWIEGTGREVLSEQSHSLAAWPAGFFDRRPYASPLKLLSRLRSNCLIGIASVACRHRALWIRAGTAQSVGGLPDRARFVPAARSTAHCCVMFRPLCNIDGWP